MKKEEDQKIENILEMPMPPFDYNSNCTYTTNGGKQAKLSLNVLLKIMEDIPKTPRILTMPIQMKKLNILPDNTILISNDIAEAIEEALKDN